MKLTRVDEYVRSYSKSMPNADALVFGDSRRTYLELEREANRTAHALRELGVGSGDVVATLLGNRPENALTLLAASKIGAVFSTLNTRNDWTTTAGMIERAGCELLIAEDEADLDAADLPDGTTLVTTRDSPDSTATFESLLAGQSDADPGVDVSLDDPVWLHWTSGTTGEPKGCLRTQYQLLQYGWTWVPFAEYGRDDVGLQFAPLYGIGLSNLLVPLFIVGGTNVLMDGFDPDRALDLIAEHGVTTFIGVPTHLRYILDAYDGTTDVSTLDRGISGGGHLGNDLVEEYLATFETRLIDNYGTSEEGVLLYQAVTGPREEGPEFEVVPGTEVRVDAPDGESGELLVRSPLRMDRYLEAEDPEEREDGLRSTGDLFRVVESGRYRYVGRSDDMIVTGGFNVFPVEVESVLAQHHDVEEVAVAGHPDEEYGETVKAFVVARSGAGDRLRERLDSYCLASDRLADYKRPRLYEFRDRLPRNSVDKIDRSRLE